MKKENSSFDRLVARYYPAVYSFAARLTDDPHDAVARQSDNQRALRAAYRKFNRTEETQKLLHRYLR